jgi:hypothetical protein
VSKTTIARTRRLRDLKWCEKSSKCEHGVLLANSVVYSGLDEFQYGLGDSPRHPSDSLRNLGTSSA